MKKLISIVLAVTIPGSAQSGGQFDLSHTVIAGGGGMQSISTTFVIDGTVGQAIAGTTSTGNGLDLHGGFWTPNAIAPTAAMVSVEGRIRVEGGGPIQRIALVLIDPVNGESRITRPNPFGYFRFDEVEVGRFYVVEAESAHYTFTPQTHSFQLVDTLSELDFVAAPVQP